VLVVSAVVGWHLFLLRHETVLDQWDNASPTVSADGRQVTLAYTRGICGDATSEVRVHETIDRVELTIVTREEVVRGDCASLGVTRYVVATLSQPLGERRLIDGHCAHPEWGKTYAC